MTRPTRYLPSWVFTANAGWSLFYVAGVLIIIGAFLGLSGSLLALYILGSLAIILCLVGGIFGLSFQGRVFTIYYIRHASGDGDNKYMYTTHVPALNIVTEGSTIANARKRARDIAKRRIQEFREHGGTIPDDVIVEHISI